MDSLPFFSIILPTFNSEVTLTNALDSIKSQSFKNYEVIIIDGLSRDTTLQIAESFKNEISGLRIFSERDYGIYDAMNKGVLKAKGEWLYFLGSDDSLYNNLVLEHVYIEITKGVYDVVYGSVNSKAYGERYDGVFDYEKLSRQNIGHQAIFFKRSVFKTIGCFNIKYKALADWEHNIRWFFSNRITKKYIDLVIAHYADGGYSSLQNDEAFNFDKPRILFRYGFMTLKLEQLVSISYKISNNAKQKKFYLRYAVYKFLHLMLKLFLKVKKRL